MTEQVWALMATVEIHVQEQNKHLQARPETAPEATHPDVEAHPEQKVPAEILQTYPCQRLNHA